MLDVAAPQILTVDDAKKFLTIDDANNFYLLISGYLVFFMQCGFAMLSAGSVRQKNTMNIILKNLLDACFGAIGWYLTGYAFAYGNGDAKDPFIAGREYYALSYTHEFKQGNDDGATLFASWFFQYTFAATAATIVSGAVAERARFEAYLAYAFLLTAWVYPVIVHWVWDANGWLSFGSDRISSLNHGMIDFAGCGVVHMTGGFAGMWGAAIVGPRIGRFDKSTQKVNALPGHNASLAILGVFILWFGWFGFNPGSTLGLHNLSMIASRCAVNTTLSAAAATLMTLLVLMLINFVQTGHVVWDLIGTSNGTLGGLVGITAACAVVQPWAAVVIGLIAGLIYVMSSKLILYVMRIDDPLDAVAVHGFCGIWGLIATAAFADKYLVGQAYNDLNPNAYGFLLGGDGGLLAAAVVGIIVIFGWVSAHMLPFFIIMKLLGLLRVDPEEEQAGLDESHHGGSAYPGDTKFITRDQYIILQKRMEVVERIVGVQGDDYHPLQDHSAPVSRGGGRGYSYQSPREDPLSEQSQNVNTPQGAQPQKKNEVGLSSAVQSKKNDGAASSSASTQSKKDSSGASRKPVQKPVLVPESGPSRKPVQKPVLVPEPQQQPENKGFSYHPLESSKTFLD